MENCVILIINPVSGGKDKSEFIQAAKDFALKINVKIVQYETSGNKDSEKIKLLYEKHQPQRILVAGGDGTIKMVAESVEDYDVILGILPAGSANGLSVDLSLPTELDEIVKTAFHDKFMEIDMICINGIKSLHLSDLGLNALLIKNYENGATRGMIGYAMQALSTLSDQEPPFKAKITTKTRTIDTEARMIVIANSQKYGTGVTINPDGKMDDGKFEIVILKNLDLLVFGKIVTGNMPLESGDVEIISVEEATIETTVPVHFQIDGEYVGEESKLDIKILHKQLKIAIP